MSLQAAHLNSALASNPDLARLDCLLLDQSYVRGWSPGPQDLALCEQLSQRPFPHMEEHYPHLCRWFLHMRAVLSDPSCDTRTKINVEEGVTVAKTGLDKCEEDSLGRKVRRLEWL